MSVKLVYVVAADESEARTLGYDAINQKLAVCVNILGTIKSIYQWKGVVHEEKECALILKCSNKFSEKLISRIKKLHSYENPCIFVIPIENGSKEFISWITSLDENF